METIEKGTGKLERIAIRLINSKHCRRPEAWGRNRSFQVR